MEKFDFQKLFVYQRIRSLNKVLFPLVIKKIAKSEYYLSDQLKRASLSVSFNLAEGTGRSTSPDKKRFYVMSRSSLFECVAILDSIYDLNLISKDVYEDFINQYTEISKMLYGLYKKA